MRIGIAFRSRNNGYLLAAILSLLVLCQISGCGAPSNHKLWGSAAVKSYYALHTDTLLEELDDLASTTDSAASWSQLQEGFARCRFRYKRIEPLAEYYFGGLIQRINGPALPDVRIEDGMVLPPQGFQVLEQLIYDGYSPSNGKEIRAAILILQKDLRFMKEQMAFNSILAPHAQEIVNHQFIRIGVLGIMGFDAPLSGLALKEAIQSLYSIEEIVEAYEGECGPPLRRRLLAAAIAILENAVDRDRFDRLSFLRDYLMPLSESYASLSGYNAEEDTLMLKPFSGTLSDLLQGKGFQPDYYSGYAVAASNPSKVALGERLFNDAQLSRSGTVSCASCHKPALYFSDGLSKAAEFVHGGSLPRNTPTLYYAGLQSRQFYDLRSASLEDQVEAVLKSPGEFDGRSEDVAGKLVADSSYKALLRASFPATSEGLNGYAIRNALAAYVRSLNPFASPFDRYLRGDDDALSQEQKNGFNLFSGKAKCASCHFVPLFNGNVPPWFKQSESEIIGVPSNAVWTHAGIDADPGRFTIHRFEELRFSFKTPGLRNVAKTPPYMHNGVYRTLDEVLTFYQKGGGVGIGIALSLQTLPSDTLALDAGEKQAIIRFLEALTDHPAEATKQ